MGVCASALFADWWTCLPTTARAQYVGRKSCVECHADQARAFADSHHDKAMDLATEKTVLADFNDATFEHKGVLSRFYRKDGKYFVNTEGPDGQPGDFEIKYVLGFDPLQQYMVEFPDGRVQVLHISWDTHQKRWFHVNPAEDIPHHDWLHWTKAGGNWNYMCAECHTTNLQKNYDVPTDQYHTTFSEIDVSCEACHGPGSLHVEMAKSKSLFWDRKLGFGLAKLKGPDPKNQIATCGRCHARRRVIHGDYVPGHEFLDHYEPELLDGDLYFPDGQIRDEDFDYGSFLQSRMYREGVRCTDCHDPHSAQLKAQGNNLCTRCHTPGKYDAPSHHHHEVDSKGAHCVECHMPERTYMVVDPRRDHSIRKPRPDLTVKLGVPNACQNCHADKPAQWAADAVSGWFGPKRDPDPHFGEIIALGRAGDPAADEPLAKLARRDASLGKQYDVGPAVRASAIALLAHYPTAVANEAIELALFDREGVVRAAAVKALDTRPHDTLTRLLPPLLDDPIRLVRTEAARVLSQVPKNMIPSGDRPTFERVLAEWREGQSATLDDSGAHMALGTVDANAGDIASAEKEFRLAMRMHPNPVQAVQARVNLAMLMHSTGHADEAEKLYREVVALEPKWAEGWYSLGLLLAENESRMSDAADALGHAADLAPDHPRIQYNHGLALQRLSRWSEAESRLKRARDLSPELSDYRHALMSLYAAQGDWNRVRAEGAEWAKLDPRQAGAVMAALISSSPRPPVDGPSRPVTQGPSPPP